VQKIGNGKKVRPCANLNWRTYRSRYIPNGGDGANRHDGAALYDLIVHQFDPLQRELNRSELTDVRH
jgi:hypothetical protein